MPIIGSYIDQREYYQNNGNNPQDENWGTYQYVLLKDIINNFMLTYVGDDKVINKADRNEVVFHAKRGLQELHYDALREIRGFEAELPDNLKMHLPHDFVSAVKVAYVGEDGTARMIPENFNTSTPISYLQDNTAQKNILMDNNDNALTGTPVIETNWRSQHSGRTVVEPDTNLLGKRFGLDTATANHNGSYRLDKDQGFILFSSDLSGKQIIIEYVSDGLYALSDGDIKIHKLAENYMYDYLVSSILKQKFGVQEYIVARAKKQASASLRNTKIRLNSIKLGELTQILRGRDKWIK
jgi:hypothetical protein